MRLLSDRLAARLSRGRRGRYAGAVVLLLGLLVTGGAYAVLSPAQASDEAADQSTVEQGRALFLVGCASCHGKNGEGVTLQNGNQYGPPLAGVGAAAVDFQVGTGRMPMARPGVQAPKKDVLYTDDRALPTRYQILDIAERLYRHTKEPRYRSWLVDLARRNTVIDPAQSWAHAFVGLYGDDSQERRLELARTLYLDASSYRASLAPAEELEAARALAARGNPLLPQEADASL